MEVWDREDVAVWLSSINLSAHVSRFREERIDGVSLTQLTEENVRDTFDMKLGDLKKFFYYRSMYMDEHPLHPEAAGEGGGEPEHDEL